MVKYIRIGEKGMLALPLLVVVSLFATYWLLTFTLAVQLKGTVLQEEKLIRCHYLAEGYMTCILTSLQKGKKVQSWDGYAYEEAGYRLECHKATPTYPLVTDASYLKLILWDKIYHISTVFIIVVQEKGEKVTLIRIDRG